MAWGGSLLKTVLMVVAAPPTSVPSPGMNARLATHRPSSSSTACSKPFAPSAFTSLGSRTSLSKWTRSMFVACSRTPTSSPMPPSIGGSLPSYSSTSILFTCPLPSTMDPMACRGKSLLMTRAKTMTLRSGSTMPCRSAFGW